jgi:hypothetical protein
MWSMALEDQQPVVLDMVSEVAQVVASKRTMNEKLSGHSKRNIGRECLFCTRDGEGRKEGRSRLTAEVDKGER